VVGRISGVNNLKINNMNSAGKGGTVINSHESVVGLPSFVEQLRGEVSGLEEREQAYFRSAREADTVMIVLGCDDSRQGIPDGTQTLDGFGETLFAFVPAIGGGVSRKNLPAVIDQFITKGIEIDHIVVAVTQHGNSAEVKDAMEGRDGARTCGLRGVLQKVEAGEQVHIPQGLADHAQATNQSSSMIKNLSYVFTETQQLLENTGVRVIGGYYDHEGDDIDGKSIDFTLGLESPISFSLVQQDAWHHSHQDPSVLVVSVGKRAVSLPDGKILPTTVGDGVNNDFNSAAVSEESLMTALYEQWYALSHVRGEGNFQNTEHMVIICDGEEQVGWVKKFMGSEDYKNDFEKYVAKLGGLHIINLSNGNVTLV
jgi:hypothetical protein